MLPLKKYITSKSVILFLIFLTSTCRGYLENTNRIYESRRNIRGSRVSLDREFREQLPFRRDTTRRANEKDVIYENLYDRRSFRTGTDRFIRNQDRGSTVEERFDLNPDNRIRFDRRTNDWQHRERSVDTRDRLFDKRTSRQIPTSEVRSRNIGNLQSRDRRTGDRRVESNFRDTERRYRQQGTRTSANRSERRDNRDIRTRDLEYRNSRDFKDIQETRRYRSGNFNNEWRDRQYRNDNRFNFRQNRYRDLEERFSGDNRRVRYTSTDRARHDDSRRSTSQNRHSNANIQLTREQTARLSNGVVRNNVYRAVLSRSDSARRILDARINSRDISNQRNIERRLPTENSRSVTRSLQSIDRRMVPVVEFVPNTGRSLESMTEDVQQSETLKRNFKFDALANVIQVILGVYLIGQIILYSSNKKPCRYGSILPSLTFVKDKLE